MDVLEIRLTNGSRYSLQFECVQLKHTKIYGGEIFFSRDTNTSENNSASFAFFVKDFPLSRPYHFLLASGTENIPVDIDFLACAIMNGIKKSEKLKELKLRMVS